jgi:hypothetical protein
VRGGAGRFHFRQLDWKAGDRETADQAIKVGLNDVGPTLVFAHFQLAFLGEQIEPAAAEGAITGRCGHGQKPGIQVWFGVGHGRG